MLGLRNKKNQQQQQEPPNYFTLFTTHSTKIT